MRIRALLALLSLAAAALPARGATRSARDVLQSYVDDYGSDPQSADPITFGVLVKGEGEWHVVVEGRKAVTLHDGPPPIPTFRFVLDRSTLDRLDTGTINALTAMGRARESDAAPMDFDFTKGFRPDREQIGRFLPVIFHFWTRGTPEIVPFGAGLSRPMHGANAVLFYYEPGVRFAWFHIGLGQHVNADPNDQSNPFPSIIVVTKGRCDAKIGGKSVRLSAGEMLFIPANTTHELWNDAEEPAEGTLLMFGKGA